MAKPKLALIPAAQGTKFYSVLPSDGTGDFTFTRGSVATRINAQGLIENVASGQSRLDYPLIDGVQKGCPHYILEPSRTNLITYSEDFSQSYWIKASVSLSSNQLISPDGTLNSDKIIESSTNGLQQIYSDVITTTPSSDYVYSIFIKKGERSWVKVMTANNSGANFNVENGIIGIVDSGVNAEIEDYGNGWFKCSVSFNTSVSADRVYVRISTSNGVTSYQGDGTSGVYIFGAMLEAGSYPTSYIPTNGTAVTRSAETANGAGNSSTFNDSEGVLMAEIKGFTENLGLYSGISISDGTVSNRITLGFSGVSSGKVLYYVNASNAGFPDAVSINSILTSNNILAISYKNNQYKMYLNGFLVSTVTTAAMPTGLNEIRFFGYASNETFIGSIKQLQYFDSILADTQLEQLTSWQSFRDMANGQLYTIE